MYADPSLAEKYFASLRELDSLASSDIRLGQKLSYIICDFIESLTDWKKEAEDKGAVGELYVKTWNQCRSFVLPMNPPRAELEFAIRTCLKKLGLSVRIPKNAFLPEKKKRTAEKRVRTADDPPAEKFSRQGRKHREQTGRGKKWNDQASGGAGSVSADSPRASAAGM